MSTLPSADHTLDIGHEGCGTLLITLRRTLRDLTPGQVVEVIGYDPVTRDEVPAWCRMTGNELVAMTDQAGDGATRFFIRKT